MQLRWTGLLAGVLMVAATGNVAAQGSVALTPYLGYINPTGSLVEQNSAACCLELSSSGGIMVGGIIELTLAKSLSISGFAASTIGLTQKATFAFTPSVGGSVLELGMATTQFGGTLRVLPLGRNPSGAPKGVYVEAGAAYELLAFSDVEDRSSSGTASPTWNSSGIVGVFGAGAVFNVGRRANLTIFGRYHMPFAEYTSDGLDDWNSVPPPDVAKKAPTIFFGVGLRTGR